MLYLKNAFHQLTAEQSARFSMAGGFSGGLSARLWPFCRDKQEQKNKTNASSGYDSDRRKFTEERRGIKELTVQRGVWSPFVAEDLFSFAESSDSVRLSASPLVILSPML